MADERASGIFGWNLSGLGFNRTKAKPTETRGVSGIVSAGGIIQTPELDPRLQGDRKWRTYSEIINETAVVGASVRYFLNLVAKAEWKAEPVDDTPAAIEAAEFIDEVLDRMETSWHRIVRRAALYRFYGFSTQEWTAQKWDDGRIGITDVELRPQRTIRRWDLDLSGTVQGIGQWAPQTGTELYIPRSKMLYLVDDSLTDDPEGNGLMRQLAGPSARMQRYLQMEGWGFETDLRGIPVGRAPKTKLKKQVKDGVITASEEAAALADMRSFLENHIRSQRTGYLLDSEPYRNLDPAANPTNVMQWGFELLQGSATSFPEMAKAIDRLNHEMAWILGTEGLLLGSDQGSFALSKSKSNNLYLVVDSVLTEIAQGADRDIVDNVWALNGLDEELKPHLTTESAQFKDVEQITAALRDMSISGAPLSPDDPAINTVRGLLALPDATPGMSQATLLDAALIGNGGVKPEDVGLGTPGKGKLPNGGDDVEVDLSPDNARGKATKHFVSFNSPEARRTRLAKRINKRK